MKPNVPILRKDCVLTQLSRVPEAGVTPTAHVLLLPCGHFVPEAGVEPARPKGHMALNHACLPIPAPGRCEMRGKYT